MHPRIQSSECDLETKLQISWDVPIFISITTTWNISGTLSDISDKQYSQVQRQVLLNLRSTRKKLHHQNQGAWILNPRIWETQMCDSAATTQALAPWRKFNSLQTLLRTTNNVKCTSKCPLCRGFLTLSFHRSGTNMLGLPKTNRYARVCSNRCICRDLASAYREYSEWAMGGAGTEMTLICFDATVFADWLVNVKPRNAYIVQS